MDTLYYRKIAEIVRRDETSPMMRDAAERALAVGRNRGDTVARGDRRKLRAWMLRWCDSKAATPAGKVE